MKRVFVFIFFCFAIVHIYSCRLGSNKIFGYISFIDTTSGGNYETPEDKVTIELINEARSNVVSLLQPAQLVGLKSVVYQAVHTGFMPPSTFAEW